MQLNGLIILLVTSLQLGLELRLGVGLVLGRTEFPARVRVRTRFGLGLGFGRTTCIIQHPLNVHVARKVGDFDNNE